jgi:hypothetical protein
MASGSAAMGEGCRSHALQSVPYKGDAVFIMDRTPGQKCASGLKTGLRESRAVAQQVLVVPALFCIANCCCRGRNGNKGNQGEPTYAGRWHNRSSRRIVFHGE